MATLIDNPHLADIPQPARCGKCPDHPRLLPNGICTFCGAENAPVHGPTAAAADPPAAAAERGLGPAPVFADWMRQPISSGTLLPTAQQPVPVDMSVHHRDHRQATQDGSPERRQHRSSTTTKRVQARQPCAPQTERANAGETRNPHGPSARAQGARKRKASETIEVETWALCERVNEAALADLASRRRAATWHPGKDGQGPTLRQIIADILSQVNDGTLTACFSEERQMARLGLQGRRYSGYKPEFAIDSFDRHIAEGVNPGSVGRALFGLPGWLRDLGRSGLANCYVLDMANAHPTIQNRRYGHLCALSEYVHNREQVLASIPTSRESAKLLFIRMIYGGHWEPWCREHTVSPRDLPPIVEAFRMEQEEVRRLDGEGHPELFAKLKIQDATRAEELLQYVLNTQEERRVIDAVQQAVDRLGGQTMSIEHDGLYVYAPCDETKLLRHVTAEAGYPMTVKACKGYDCTALRNTAEKLAGGGDWETVDPCWQENETLVHEARVASTNAHDLFANVLITEPQVDASVPWPIHDLFKLPMKARDYVWYDAQACCWVEGGPNGVVRLKEYITQMLERRLATYTFEDHLLTNVQVRRGYGNKEFRRGVEDCMRPKLFTHAEFQLDPDASLRYLNFKGGRCWDRETETWIRTRPEMLISRSTGWEFEECTNPAMGRVDKALALVREAQDKRGLHLPSVVPEAAVEILEQAAGEFPELKFWFDFTREWEGVLYELSHIARGLFGILMAEALYVRGSGRNGKDTACNAMQKVGGTYVQSISCDSLCNITSADNPSPTFYSVRGRRIVCVREVATDAKIQPAVYKKFTDPFSEMQARDLFSHLVKFRPQYLAFFASNGPIPIAMDNAVSERTAIVDHVSVFKDCPVESNDLQWRDMDSLLTEFRPGFFWLLRRVYHHLLRGRTRRNVGPVPASSLGQKALDCADSNTGSFLSFLNKLTPVRGPKDASTQLEVDAAAAEALGLSQSQVSIYLSGKGFLKLRRMRGLQNEYFYQYSFTIDGEKTKAQFMRLPSANAARAG